MSLTTQQLAIRENKLTGSTVAGFLGRHPDKSPSETWDYHTGAKEFAGNDATEVGLFVEQGLGRLCQKRLKLGPMEAGTTIIHPGYPEMWAATPDFLFPEAKIGLQIKNHSPHMKRDFIDMPGKRGEWDNEIIPIYHQMQCQWEMAAVNALRGGEWKVWILGCFFGGWDFRLYRVRYHRKLLDGMIAVALQFHKRHLDPAGPRSRPDDSSWKPRKPEARKPQKMSLEELAAAPVHF